MFPIILSCVRVEPFHVAYYLFCVGVEPVGNDTAEWCNEAKRRFEELTVEKKLVAKLRRSQNYGDSFGEKPKVQLELYDTSDPKKDVLIADVLVNEGLAKRIADHA